MMVLLVLLALCLLVSVWVAIRRPVIFKLGVRNIPRRKAQTILIVVGLMLSTLIISAAMTTGDTLNHSVSSMTYDLLGQTDELVVFSSETEDANIENAITQKIPASALGVVQQALAGHPDVDGIAPGVFELVPVVNETNGLGEPESSLAGFNPADVDTFGGLSTPDGDSVDFASLQQGQVIISETMQDDLDAKVGDTLTVTYQNQPYTVTVAGVATDQVLAGSLNPDMPAMVMHLDQMQQMLGLNDVYSAILISNTGGVRGPEGLSDSVEAALLPALEGQSLGVNLVKKDLVEQSELFANVFTSIFLVMGLFSMAVGILLIVLIFSMLAAERRSEMGMERAVGARRRQLIQQFIAEGTGYSLLAGIAGSAFGVLVALGIALLMGRAFEGEGLSISPSVEPRSLIIAYCLGVVITFFAVVIGSWRISRLNIVAAIRDIPEVSHHRRRPRILIFGIILTAIGVLMAVSAGTSMALFGIGMSLWPFGILLITRFFGIPSRIVSTLVGIFIVTFWLLPDSTFKKIFGDEYTGDFELFFISGIFLVLGATVVIVQNTDLLLRAVSWFGGLFRSKLPAVRTAVAYPGSARGRTGMTIAMFSLIIFSLVMMATISENFTKAFLSDEAAAGWNVRADGGFSNPIDDFESTLQSQGVDTSSISAIGEVDSPVAGATQARSVGNTDWEYYGVHGMDQGFMENATLQFQYKANGYDTDQAIVDALRSGQPVAVADPSVFFPAGGDPFGGAGLGAEDTVENDRFEPFQVEVLNPVTGDVTQLTIIGIIDSNLSSLLGIYTSRDVTDAIFQGDRGFTSYFLKLSDPGQSEAMADQIEATLLTNGVQAVSIKEELEDAQSQSRTFLYLIEGFMGLGLIVGVAAIGVIAFRNVVERRQQIGVLRALGFRRDLVSLSFMIETAFVVLMGILSGGAMGLLLARNLFQSDDFSDGATVDFSIPWPIILIVLAATLVAALLMTWIPARQASRIAPAEALRYE
jgi:putative ABC transport system permease protein